MAALGADLDGGGLRDTPRRIADAELLTPERFNLTTFPNGAGYDELIVVRDIPFQSLYLVTAHHVIKNAMMIEIEVPDPMTHGELFEPVSVEDWFQPFAQVDHAIASFPFDAPEVPRYQATPLDYFVEEGGIVPLGAPIITSGSSPRSTYRWAAGARLGHSMCTLTRTSTRTPPI